MSSVIMLNIELPCPACAGHPDSQPNHCRKCGGLGYLRSTISKYQLARMGEIPKVLGASIVVAPRQKRKAVGVRK